MIASNHDVVYFFAGIILITVKVMNDGMRLYRNVGKPYYVSVDKIYKS